MNGYLKTFVFFPLLSICVLLFPGRGAGAAIIFKLNHQFPESAAGSEIDQWFADEIKAATGGEVEIKIFWSNGLGEPRDNLTLLKQGSIDMAAMSAGYFPDQLPLHSAPNAIPMAMDNVCQSGAIMKAFSTDIPAFSEETAANGVRALFFHLLNPYLLVTKEPVTSLSQLSGMRIRTWGTEMPRLIEAAGAKPVPLFLPDLYEAMQKGIIDGCPFSVDLVVTYKIHEFAKHITEVVLWEGPSWGLWIASQSWEKLLPRHRQIFLETAEKARQKELPMTLAAEKSARAFLKTHGVAFHKFPPEDLARWRAANPDFFNDFISRAESLGRGEAARHMIEIWKRMRKRTACP